MLYQERLGKSTLLKLSIKTGAHLHDKIRGDVEKNRDVCEGLWDMWEGVRGGRRIELRANQTEKIDSRALEGDT